MGMGKLRYRLEYNKLISLLDVKLTKQWDTVILRY